MAVDPLARITELTNWLQLVKANTTGAQEDSQNLQKLSTTAPGILKYSNNIVFRAVYLIIQNKDQLDENLTRLHTVATLALECLNVYPVRELPERSNANTPVELKGS